MKKFYMTSEFWASLIAQVVGMLVLVGGIASTDADKIKALGTEVVGGFIALVSLIQYIKSRTTLKQTVIDNMPPIQPDPVEAPGEMKMAGMRMTVHDRYRQALKQAGV